MKASELARLLAADAEGVAEYLLPNGKRKGREWVVGDVEGSDGESLKVCLSGSKAGVWCDFASEESGDLIGLWMATQGLSLHAACEAAEKYLGVAKPSLMQPVERVWSRPDKAGVTKLADPLREWLRTVRKISDQAIYDYCVASKKGALMFPYLRDGELVFAKYRKAPAKEFWTDKDCEPCLFGWQAIPDESRSVTLCEGELDALALYDYGFPALSVPFGGGRGEKQAWIAAEFDRLSRYDEIFLCLDQDEAGAVATAEIVQRLGRERCRLVKLPRKDANDCLMANVPRETIAEAFENAKTCDPASLISAYDYAAEVEEEFQEIEGGEVGIRLPWDSVRDRIVLRRGEVSLWFGINGHGKTEVVGHIVACAMDAVRCCVASLEFLPRKWLRRLVRQITASAHPTPSHIRHVMQWMRGRMWLYAVRETADRKDMVETYRYAARRYGVQLFVIDNLAKCGIAEDDYSEQKKFIDQLTAFARDENVHLMLVAHSKKTEKGESRPPDKFDAKGSSSLSDMVDTVISVWRNKPKEHAIEEGSADAETMARPDCLLNCVKQRNGEHEPVIALWFDRHSHQYRSNPQVIPRPLLGLQEVS